MKKFVTGFAVGAIGMVMAALSLFGIEYIYEELVYAVWSDTVLYAILVGVPFLMGILSDGLASKLTQEPQRIVIIKNAEGEIISKETEVA